MMSDVVFVVLLAALMISASFTIGFSNIALVRADDGYGDSANKARTSCKYLECSLKTA